MHYPSKRSIIAHNRIANGLRSSQERSVARLPADRIALRAVMARRVKKTTLDAGTLINLEVWQWHREFTCLPPKYLATYLGSYQGT